MYTLLHRLSAFMLVSLIALPLIAQERTGSITITDRDGSSVTIEMRDGTFFYLGDEVTPDDDGKITLQTEDGERSIYVFTEDGRSRFAIGDDREEAESLYRKMLENRWFERPADDDEDFRVFFHNEGPASLRSFQPQLGSNDLPGLRDDFAVLHRNQPRFFSVDDNFPERLLRPDDPMAQFGPRGLADDAMHEQRREITSMEREAQALARDARRATGEEREELEAELKAHLAELFELRLNLREKALKQLASQLEEQRATLNERRAMRDRIIERRLRDLMGERDVLDW